MKFNTSVPKIKSYFIDVECSPQLSQTYGPHHEASVLSVVRSPYLFCFSFIPINGGKCKVVALPDFPLYKKDPHNDLEVARALYKLISEADEIVAHNASFDLGMAKARFIHHGFPPIKPPRVVCTLKMARKVAKFPANSLKELALFCHVTHKMETSKYLWQKVMEGKCWPELKLYNKIDSEVGREILKVLRGWDTKPFKDPKSDACVKCGGNDFTLQGFRMTIKGKLQRLKCEICGAWSQTKNTFI